MRLLYFDMRHKQVSVYNDRELISCFEYEEFPDEDEIKLLMAFDLKPVEPEAA